MGLIGSGLLTITMLVTSALPEAQTAPNEFVFANENEPETIDPHKASGVPDNNIVKQMFEGLIGNAADWVTLVPGLAKEIPQPLDGGKRYIFTLRDNLKWSDGTPLTAKDFEYSWLRAMQPSTLGPYSYWLTDTIVGAAEYAKNPTPEMAKKVGVKALDNQRFEVRLKKPVPYFLKLTADSIMYPVKQSVIEKHGDQWTRPENIVVSGPYTLKSWKVNQEIRLSKNPHYWDAKNVAIEEVAALPITNKQTAVNLFKQGALDWSGHNGAPNTHVARYRNDPNFRISPSFITYFYRFNTTKPPLDDKRVRQALTLAINREALVRAVTRGGETPTDAFVPPNTGDYVSPDGLSSGNFMKDVQRARALLAEAGYPDGQGLRELTLQYDTKELHKNIAVAIQAMWKEHLGINVKPFNQEWKVYLRSQREMDFDISRSGWMGDYPDAATFLELFTSTSGNNHTGFASKKYDELFNASLAETKPKERLKLLKEAEGILLEEAAIAPIFVYVNFGFVRPEVKGFVANLVDRPYVRYYSKEGAKLSEAN